MSLFPESSRSDFQRYFSRTFLKIQKAGTNEEQWIRALDWGEVEGSGNNRQVSYLCAESATARGNLRQIGLRQNTDKLLAYWPELCYYFVEPENTKLRLAKLLVKFPRHSQKKGFTTESGYFANPFSCVPNNFQNMVDTDTPIWKTLNTGNVSFPLEQALQALSKNTLSVPYTNRNYCISLGVDDTFKYTVWYRHLPIGGIPKSRDALVVTEPAFHQEAVDIFNSDLTVLRG